MKKHLIALAVCLSALHAHADDRSEPSLNRIISTRFAGASFTDITGNLAPLWTSLSHSGQSFSLVAEYTRGAPDQQFYVRYGNGSTALSAFTLVFGGAAVRGDTEYQRGGITGFAFSSGAGSQSSIYATTTGSGHFPGQSTWGSFHAYQRSGGSIKAPDFVLAYEDYYDTKKRPGDYNDMVISVSAVPEPSTYAMMLAGLALTGAVARRRRRSKA